MTTTISGTSGVDNIQDNIVTAQKLQDNIVTAQKLFSTLKEASFATNGYTKLPSGIILQWGVGSGPITFPIPFPNAALNVIVQLNANSTTPTGPDQTFINSLTNSGFNRASNSNSVRYFAIGY